MGRLGRMIWRDGEETPEGGVEAPPEENTDPIRIERDAPRPAMILKVAGELEERGGTILELFKEIKSPLGRVVLPIHLRRDDRDFFVEVSTGPWDERKTSEALDMAAILRSSEHAGAGLEILSGYPVPPEVEFYFGTSPAALLQLDLARLTPERPEVCAGRFREVGSNHWGVDLDYDPGYLPLVEELLMAALEGDEATTARRSPTGSWPALDVFWARSSAVTSVHPVYGASPRSGEKVPLSRSETSSSTPWVKPGPSSNTGPRSPWLSTL